MVSAAVGGRTRAAVPGGSNYGVAPHRGHPFFWELSGFTES